MTTRHPKLLLNPSDDLVGAIVDVGLEFYLKDLLLCHRQPGWFSLVVGAVQGVKASSQVTP